MRRGLPFGVVELVPCPEPAILPSGPGAVGDAALREVAFRADAWLPDEVASLRERFAGDEALEGIAAALGRTRAAVATKVGELGLRRNSLCPWTEADDAALARGYGTLAASAIAAALGRSPAAVYARAGALGLTEGNPPPYTGWEIAQIRAGYAAGVPVSRLAALIARPASGIATVASRLRVRHANAPAGWSPEEQRRAVALAETGLRYRAVAARLAEAGFPPREGRTVGQMLRKLGYGRGWGLPWTAEEDALVRVAYARGASLAPLRGVLGRSRTAIAARAAALGLRGSHARPRGFRTDPDWTEAQLAMLRDGYGHVPTPELARRLGRGKGAVHNKAHALGLVHGYHRPFAADEDRAIRIAHAAGVSMTDLALALGRDVAVVSKRARRGLGLDFAGRAARPPRGPRADRPPPLTLADILALDAAQPAGAAP